MTKFGFDVLRLPINPDEWCDADERIFLAGFAVLTQFVESELGEAEEGDASHRGYRLHSADIEPNDPSGLEPRRSSDRDAIDLYLWHRDELPRLEADYDAEVRRCYGGDGVMTFAPTGNPHLRQIEVKPKGEMKYPYNYPEQVKDEKLRQLMELRRSLWT